jgi:hypothetical protein
MTPQVATTRPIPALERRGRAWLVWSFLLCPCHLPLTLAALTTVLAGTSLGVTVRDHVWLAAAIITTVWLTGTGYGLRLIRQAETANGSCPTKPTATPAASISIDEVGGASTHVDARGDCQRSESGPLETPVGHHPRTCL